MGYRKIVCGVTGSAHGQKAALEAARLAKENSAGLVYVYAVDLDFMRGGMTMELTHHDAEDSLVRIGTTILEQAEEVAMTHGVTPKKIVRKGPVLEVLRSVISEEKADLLVLGHEERTFFEKVLLKGEVEDHVEALKQQTGIDIYIVK
jgi:nucleotide-binding universal stress UspA family protein